MSADGVVGHVVGKDCLSTASVAEATQSRSPGVSSYGFRPGRSPHGALRALRRIIVLKKVGHLFEADIRGYFNHIQHDWLQAMVAHRIADPLILRLIGKWLNAGFMAGGVVTRTEEGSPQGGPISPILSNIYLHYVLDL